MSIELGSKYDHASVEAKWQERWEAAGAFAPEYAAGEYPADRESFCIVIPPPNVTGELHVGHALDQTVQDVLTRAMRKRGKKTLWLPGMDHAGIATQVRVEKNLQAEGLDRHQLGREKFIEKVWEWKEQSGGAILRQQRRMGFSLDWSRTRFTMDDGLSRAVRKVFVDLYNDGLLYRDTRMVNWDPVAHTVLSDLEVEYEEGFKSELYHFAYPLSGGETTAAGKGQAEAAEIIVATTRPETMLGDTAIAVHPDDKRYQHLIGKTVNHPFIDRKIKIIADAELVDMEFGTGAVKVTPAHDPNDYETGRRHNLEFITIFDESARINKNGGAYEGLDRFAARKKIKADLAEAGLERGSKEHVMSVGRSQRSGEIVEPLVSTQWFVKVGPLAKTAIEKVEDGTIRFVPKQWENLYFHWMREIRDWCISRQLWWGHQIPAWHCNSCGHVTVALDDPTACESCRSEDIKRDPDVLDTWFSSALWPFSTMGWPDQTEDLKTFYPTSVLVTGFDIIFFWVARMVMMGLHFMQAPPFHDIYIHGLLRDEKGEKMSKTKGNVVDPLKAVEEFGADAFRFFLMATLAEGKDTLYSQARLKGYQNFANKIWNSSRFVLMNLPEDFRPEPETLHDFALEAEDWWILSELAAMLENSAKAIEQYRFHIAADEVYSFTWNLFCDWYIEFIKPRLFGKTTEESAEAARQVAYFTLRSLLHALHPFMPHITEELYAYLLNFRPAENKLDQFLMTAPWPQAQELPERARKPAAALALLQEVIGATRQLRAEMNIPPDAKVKIRIRSADPGLAQAAEDKRIAIERLARADEVSVATEYAAGKFDAMQSFSAGEVFLPLEGLLDIAKETKRLQTEIARLDKTRGALEGKLKNEKFLANAPADVVEKEKEKLTDLQTRLAALQTALARLAG